MNPELKFSFEGKIWKYKGGKASWYLVTLPVTESQAIKFYYGRDRRGWGAVPVEVTIGSSVWTTSVFPDKKAGAYLLPVKAEVRKAEGLDDGTSANVTIEVKF